MFLQCPYLCTEPLWKQAHDHPWHQALGCPQPAAQQKALPWQPWRGWAVPTSPSQCSQLALSMRTEAQASLRMDLCRNKDFEQVCKAFPGAGEGRRSMQGHGWWGWPLAALSCPCSRWESLLQLIRILVFCPFHIKLVAQLQYFILNATFWYSYQFSYLLLDWNKKYAVVKYDKDAFTDFNNF